MLTTSPAARTALIYVTLGSLILVWTGVWYFWTVNHPPDGRGVYYLLAGLFASGMTLLVIGLGVGRLGHAARHADNPAIVVAAAAPPNTAAVIAPQTPEGAPAQAPTAAPAPAAPRPAEAPRVASPSPPVAASAGNRFHHPHAAPTRPIG